MFFVVLSCNSLDNMVIKSIIFSGASAMGLGSERVKPEMWIGKVQVTFYEAGEEHVWKSFVASWRGKIFGSSGSNHMKGVCSMAGSVVLEK